MIGTEFSGENGRFLQGPNQWLEEEDCSGIREIMTQYFETLLVLSKVLFRLMALSLNLDENYFDNFVGAENCEMVKKM
jgi:isopenicillin N synthase-like dioxygenase